ncbi:MAG TPA: tryptophan--tRNA ligase [Candidatus Fimivicinus intestinavium]|nr:tryptophan--tRNA ligase [Candidatus Fimivicinus intestinavium]
MEQQTQRKKKILSAIQPSGIPTLGNYLGALKNWAAMAEEYDCAYAVADLHAITVRQNPAELRRRTLELYALLLAIGLDPEKNLVFIQSQVPTHAQLAWVLNCYTQFGEMSRMTQFKDKSAQHADNVNVGLFAYPVLMAADILLYQADFVPVGADQKQHLEITRDIAGRFNGIYGNVFTIPEPFIGKEGARVMSLQEPEKKMSKSDPNVNGFISMLDEPEVIMRKFKRAVTDSEARVACEEGRAGINNLMGIYSCCTGKTMEQIEQEFDGKGYGAFKTAVAEAVIEELRPVQERFRAYMNDLDYIRSCAAKGAEAARRVSQRTLDKVMKKVGFVLG